MKLYNINPSNLFNLSALITTTTTLLSLHKQTNQFWYNQSVFTTSFEQIDLITRFCNYHINQQLPTVSSVAFEQLSFTFAFTWWAINK